MSYIQQATEQIGAGEEINVVHVGGFAWTGEYVSHTPFVLRLRSVKTELYQPRREAATDHFINVAHIAGINVKGLEP